MVEDAVAWCVFWWLSRFFLGFGGQPKGEVRKPRWAPNPLLRAPEVGGGALSGLGGYLWRF